MRRRVLTLAVLLTGGCAHRTQGPADVAAAFSRAVDGRDYAAAYALTSTAYQQRVPLAAFRAAIDARGPGAPPLVQRLTPAGRGPVRVTLDLGLGESLPLVQEAAGFRIDAPPLAPFPQDTPRAALRSFVRAAEQRRFDVLLRLAPTRVRTALTEAKLRAAWDGEGKAALDRLVGELRANVAAPIVELGDEAHMPYGEHELNFVREDGLWKVDEPD